MVRAWVYNEEDTSDQRNYHHLTPNHPITTEQLSLLGIHYWHIDPTTAVDKPLDGKLGEIRAAREYKNHDVITVSPDKLPNYEEKIKMFFEEHLHQDEEIRFVLEGSGFFDIRDEADVANLGRQGWIRIQNSPGDMIVLPAGSYHRFTLDSNNYIKAMRLFKDAPKWEALNRGGEKADSTSSRAEYLAYLEKQQATLEDIRKRGADGSQQSVSTKESANGISYTLRDAAGSLANYPHMRRYNGQLYVSGLSSRRPDGTHRGVTYDDNGKVIGKDAGEQTRAVIENIENVLHTAGADLTQVLDATCFLTDMSDYAAFNKAWNQFFSDPLSAPTRTTIAVKQLPHPNLLIEIKIVAADPQHRSSKQ